MPRIPIPGPARSRPAARSHDPRAGVPLTGEIPTRPPARLRFPSALPLRHDHLPRGGPTRHDPGDGRAHVACHLLTPRTDQERKVA